MADAGRSTIARLLVTMETLSSSKARNGLTVAELARELRRDKSVVSRQLRLLVELGLVERSPEGHHRLGWRLFTLAARAGDQRLLLLAPPVLRRLADVTGERVHLSVLHGREVLTILSESSRQVIEAVGWVGRTSPVHCTSSGRALLFDHADDEIRQLLKDVPFPGPGPAAPKNVEDLLHRLHQDRLRGFSTVNGEFNKDLSGAAAPIRDFSGRIIAALNVSAPSFRLGGRLSSVGQQVASAAVLLTQAISSAPDTPPPPPRNSI
ncbi:IclR family transcriptional regulator [Thermostaphylospora chromogena]|uniref:DNA-binding transcriptional regulator, IclR family n=1 Tax=Thermostaphylospora chromogena TaxID=35622 RepID=A0A1H1CZL5_9ACTN|nr:IclR family transcriptional regulator [Thermostaphylospora chromogena]SDQ69685.1 DNA-binding transcriptional regulator, IclR family [Thermostaphylospora chromogena]